MLKCHGNQESIHFINWLLHSGCINLPALVEGADARAAEIVSGDPQADKRRLPEIAWNCLAAELHRIVDRVIYEFTAVDDLEAGYLFLDPEAYQGCPSGGLLAPLFAAMIERIDFGLAADLVFTKVSGIGRLPFSAEAQAAAPNN